MEREHAAAEHGPGAPVVGHLDVVHGRPDRLRGQARILYADGYGRQLPVAQTQHVGARIGIAEGGDPGKDVAGAAVPEVAEVENRVDDGRRVADGDLAYVQPCEA